MQSDENQIICINSRFIDVFRELIKSFLEQTLLTRITHNVSRSECNNTKLGVLSRLEWFAKEL